MSGWVVRFRAGLLLAAQTSATAGAQLTERVSVNSSEAQGNGLSANTSISHDGRYVAFKSYASNLVSGDSNSSGDIFVRDRLGGTTERVSVASSGAQGNGDLESASRA